MFAYFHWNVDPVIFRLGPISVRYYGLLFALAFVAGYEILNWIFIREKKDVKELESFVVAMILGAVIGARLGHCLFYEPSYYLSNPLEILKVWKGGLASHGAAIGITVALVIFLKSKPRQSGFLWYADRSVIPIALGASFVRLGNLFNSEIIGKPAELPWSIVLNRIDQVPRHPSQLYEALSYAAIFVFLLVLYKKKSDKLTEGTIFGWFLALLFSARFVIEFFKETQVPFENSLPLDMGQLLSLPLILIGLYFLFRPKILKKKSR